MAQQLLDLLPKRINVEWSEEDTVAVRNKICEDVGVLRNSPLFPFHRLLCRRVPVSIVETHPDLVTLPNAAGQLPIEQAIRNGTIDAHTFQLLLMSTRQKIPDFVTRKKHDTGHTLLHSACTGGGVSLPIVQAIHDIHPEALLAKTDLGNRPIHHIRNVARSLPAIRFMVEQHPFLLMEPDHKGNLLLHKVFQDAKHEEALLYLLQANPKACSVPNKQGALPLHLAVLGRSRHRMTPAEQIKALIEAHPEAVQTSTSRGYLPLHWALSGGNDPPDVAVIKLLLEAYPDSAKKMSNRSNPTIEEEDEGESLDPRDDYLPLHLACRNRGIGLDVIQALLQAYPQSAGAPTGRLGVLPLHIACATPGVNLPVLQRLEQSYPQAAQTADYCGSLPFHLAVTHASTPTLDWLWERHPDAISHQDSQGMLPIHLALATFRIQDRLAIIKKMIAEFPQSLQVPNCKGLVPLHYACLTETDQREEIIGTLLEIDPEAASHASDQGKLPIHYLCSSGNPSLLVLEALLRAHPVGIEAATDKGLMPLHVACTAGQHLPFIQKLADLFPNAILHPTTNGRLPLHLSCEYRCDLDVVQYLTQRNPDGMTVASSCGRLPLHYACAHRDRVIIISGGGRPYPENDYPTKEQTLLSARHMGRAFEGKMGRPIPGQGTVEWIAREYPHTAKHTDANGWTPLHAACANGICHAAVLEALLEVYPEAATVQDDEGWLPLHCAVAWGNPREIIQKIIGRESPTLAEWDLPLRFDYCIHRKGKGHIIDRLLALHPDGIRVADKEGWLPIHCAIASGTTHEPLFDCYQEHFPEAYAAASADGSLPLHIFAAKKGCKLDSENGKKLIRCNEDALEVRDGSGRTPRDVERQSESLVVRHFRNIALAP